MQLDRTRQSITQSWPHALACGLVVFLVACEVKDTPPSADAESQEPTIVSRIDDVRNQISDLRAKLDRDLPAFKTRLEAGFRDVHEKMQSAATDYERDVLGKDRQKYAQALVALEQRRSDYMNLVTRLESNLRNLELSKDLSTHLGVEQSELIGEIDSNMDEARVLSQEQLDRVTGSGAIEAAMVEERIANLLDNLDDLPTTDSLPPPPPATTSSASPNAPSHGTVPTANSSVTQGQTFTNELGMTFVWIAAGELVVPAGNGSKPVRVNVPYAIMDSEVTQGQWKAVMRTTPWRGVGKEFSRTDDNAAVTYVSAIDAVEFCRKLSEMGERTYTLPTPDEWEYACRAGATTAFSFGDDPSAIGQYAWYAANTRSAGQDYPHPVKRKQPNGWKLYDMHGNVAEWCGNVPGLFLVSGGKWTDGPQGCTSETQQPLADNARTAFVGFRPVIRVD